MLSPDPLVLEMAHKFAQERLAPGAAAREKAAAIEPEIIAALGELGFLGATTSAAWDGSELDPVTYALALEEIAAGDGSVSTLVSVHNSPTCIVLEQFGSDAQRDRWLRPLARGEHVGSFALTEPQAGSDASNLRTRAVKRGDRYVINGAKQFISSASIPGSTVLFAVTDPYAGKRGLSCFVVDKATPGYIIARKEQKLGQAASETCALTFQDMEVAEHQRIGAEGEGYRIALVDTRIRPHRHRRASRRHGTRGIGLRHRLRPRSPGLRRAHHRPPGGRLPPGRRQDAAVGGAPACHPRRHA